MFSLPLWLFLSVITGLLSNIYNFINRYLLKGNDDPTAYAWFTEFVRFIFFGVFALFNWKLIINQHSFFALLCVGITEFIGGYFYMKMHSYAHLSISPILTRTRLIWVPIIGIFLLHENLNLFDYAGILIIFLGVSTIMAPRKFFVDKGALYANVSTFFIAFNVVLIKLAVPFASIAVINTFQALPGTILYPFFMKNVKVRIKTFIKTNFPLKIFAVLVSVAQLYVFIYALNFGEASKINAVYQGMLVFGVLAGIIFLKERENISKKLIGAVITIIGVMLLTLY
jgi:drug/metabolite transporter (DMT)-like permease